MSVMFGGTRKCMCDGCLCHIGLHKAKCSFVGHTGIPGIPNTNYQLQVPNAMIVTVTTHTDKYICQLSPTSVM